MPKDVDVVVIGGGLAGIGAARELQNQGVDYVLLEASDRLGGKLKTDNVDGFLIDQGFQVHFTAYEQLFGLNDQLGLGYFRNGACIVGPNNEQWVVDRLRPLRTVMDGAFGFKDKLVTLVLTAKVWRGLRIKPDTSIEHFLKEFGFSLRFIDHFARPFVGGISVDCSLQESANQLLRIWRYLSKGRTALPRDGIEAIPRILSEGLSPSSIFLNTAVTSMDSSSSTIHVRTESESFYAKGVIVATPAKQAALLSGVDFQRDTKHSVSLYFSADSLPVLEPYLVIKSAANVVNHLAPLSLVQPSYAPEGKHLVCAVCVGKRHEMDEELASIAIREIENWFPDKSVSHWKLISVVRNDHSQLVQKPGFQELCPPRSPKPNIFFAGEFVSTSSINDALASGKEAAVRAMAVI